MMTADDLLPDSEADTMPHIVTPMPHSLHGSLVAQIDDWIADLSECGTLLRRGLIRELRSLRETLVMWSINWPSVDVKQRTLARLEAMRVQVRACLKGEPG